MKKCYGNWMRRQGIVLFSVALLFLNVEVNAQNEGTISGQVIENGGQGIAEIAITVYSQCDESPIRNVNTGTDGSYTVSVPEGNYYMNASISQDTNGLFVPEWWNNDIGIIDCNQSAVISVTADQTTRDINFSLEPGYIVSGKVMDNQNNPIPGVVVGATGLCLNPIYNWNNANTQGEYSLIVPRNTDIYIGANPMFTGLKYMMEWYDGGTGIRDCNAAEKLTDGGTDIDFYLEPGGIISGYVYQSDGTTPIDNAHLYVLDNTTNQWIGGTHTDENGSYAIMLPSGTYRLTACPDCEKLPFMNQEYNSALTVTAPDDTSNINFSLESGGTISGYVYQSDGTTPIDNVHLYALDNTTNQWIGGTHTDENGSYSIVLPSGTYRVTACPNCQKLPFVDQEYDSALIVTAPDDTPNIDFSLESGDTISGKVTDSQNNAVAQVCVDIGGKCNNPPFGGNQTDDQGNYSLTVPKNTEIYVSVNPSCNNLNYIGEWYDGSNGTQDCNNASAVKDGAENLNFSLETGGTITGKVADSGGNGLSNIFVNMQAEPACGGPHFIGVRTDENGDYEIKGIPQ